ncbi:hypothetical protein, partial [Pseudoalteromonas distincta]|uniref:hypothetical protein n=1 Tax=Pseudoalteromonas distincta TaxID=77608 RepID=UPI0034E85EA1
KLAISSSLTIGLVALMILVQVNGSTNVQKLSIAASEQQMIALAAADAKSSVRGMQIGIRDILSSPGAAEMQKAVEYCNARQAEVLKFLG